MSGVSSRVRTAPAVTSTSSPTAPVSGGPVTASLEALAAEGWVVLDDQRRRRRSTSTGLVLVGVGGVVVVDLDERLWRLSVDEPVLRLGRRSGTRVCVATAARTAGVLSLLGAEHRDAVRGVLCIADGALPAVEVEAGVLAVGGLALADALRALPARLSAHEVQRTAAHLDRELNGASPSGAQDAAAAGGRAVPAPRTPVDGAPVSGTPTPLAVFGTRRPADRASAQR